MAATGPNKDSKGETLRTHSDTGFAIPRPDDVDTSGPNRNAGTYKRPKNRAQRRFAYDEYICYRCKTKMPSEELNVEGSLHHRTPVHCLDQKECGRRRRKK